MKKIVYVCSPLRGDIQNNLLEAAGYCKEVVQAGFIPYCPHLFYSSFLDDTVAADREAGVAMGLAFIRERMTPDTDELWVYGPKVSEGMIGEIYEARATGMRVVNCGPLFSLPAEELEAAALYRIRFFDKRGAFDDRVGAILFAAKPLFTASEYAQYACRATFRVLDNENISGWRLFARQQEKWTECRDMNGDSVGYDSGRRISI